MKGEKKRERERHHEPIRRAVKLNLKRMESLFIYDIVTCAGIDSGVSSHAHGNDKHSDKCSNKIRFSFLGRTSINVELLINGRGISW